MDGASVLTKSLSDQGISHIYGIVGIPIMEVGYMASQYDIEFIAMRNEQSASYAAGAVGYLTQRPGCCLVVSGPGVIHGLAGLANAQANCWPMLLIGGANDSDQNGTGAFQEFDQIEAVRPYVKYAARPDCIGRIPFYVEQAVRMSIQGRPGPVYLDIPADLITGSAENVVFVPRTPNAYPMAGAGHLIQEALDALTLAKRPLIIVGKGAAYARAESEVEALVNKLGMPFLATPMGKGVIRDDHALSAAAARSMVLKNADIILLIGARLNWMLHFGLPPRFARDVKFIHVDVCAEEIGNNVPAHVAIVGDAKTVTGQLVQCLQHVNGNMESSWLKGIEAKKKSNAEKTRQLMKVEKSPMTYYRAYRDVASILPKDCIIIGEGANTMDIGRTIMNNYYPRHRLDAGTFGTMGVGVGFAIAAATTYPDKKIVAVQGDSAFGFSAMEVETACRYKLPILFIIINNGGIYSGIEDVPEDMRDAPPTALTSNTHYETIVTAFGGKGYYVDDPKCLKSTLDEAVLQTVPTVVNIIIEATGSRKAQEFEWLTKSNL